MVDSEKVAAFLRQVAELVAEGPAEHLDQSEREELQAKVRVLTAECDALQAKVRGYDEDRRTERDRVDRLVTELDVMRQRRDAVKNERDRALSLYGAARVERNRARLQRERLLGAIDRHAAKAISLDDLLEIAEGVRGLPSPDKEGEA